MPHVIYILRSMHCYVLHASPTVICYPFLSCLLVRVTSVSPQGRITRAPFLADNIHKLFCTAVNLSSQIGTQPLRHLILLSLASFTMTLISLVNVLTRSRLPKAVRRSLCSSFRYCTTAASRSPNMLLKLRGQRLPNSVHHHASTVVARSFSTCKKPIRTQKLEVERKFIPHNISEPLRFGDFANPHDIYPLYKPFSFVGISDICDVYYDLPHGPEKLMDQGIYVRKRNGEWEVKIRKSGNYVNSKCIEVQGKQKVKEVLGKVTRLGKCLQHVKEAARILTKRLEYKSEGFSIILDSYQVVLDYSSSQKSCSLIICGQIGEEGTEEVKGREMDIKLETFMNTNEWAFPRTEGAVEGKLTKCLKWDKRFHADAAFLERVLEFKKETAWDETELNELHCLHVAKQA
jgi:thiamine-triphosphatase